MRSREARASRPGAAAETVSLGLRRVQARGPGGAGTLTAGRGAGTQGTRTPCIRWAAAAAGQCGHSWLLLPRSAQTVTVTVTVTHGQACAVTVTSVPRARPGTRAARFRGPAWRMGGRRPGRARGPAGRGERALSAGPLGRFKLARWEHCHETA